MTNHTIYMALEVAMFLVLSAAMWLTIKHADTGADAAAHATQMAPVQDTAACVDALEDRSYADQLVPL
jgi:hypothetical protein